MPKKNDNRVPLQAPYLGYLRSMVERPEQPLRVHLIDRATAPLADPNTMPTTHHAACGEVIRVDNLYEYKPTVADHVRRRISACRHCVALHPNRFDSIQRCIP